MELFYEYDRYAGCNGTVANLPLPADFELYNILNFTNLIGYGAICNKV
jgi:hypothetical protein